MQEDTSYKDALSILPDSSLDWIAGEGQVLVGKSGALWDVAVSIRWHKPFIKSRLIRRENRIVMMHLCRVHYPTLMIHVCQQTWLIAKQPEVR